MKLRPRTWMKKAWKTDKFICTGRVHPSEYDWKEQYHDVAVMVETTGRIVSEMGVGKVLGLCTYIEELEKRLSLLTLHDTDPAVPCIKGSEHEYTNECSNCGHVK